MAAKKKALSVKVYGTQVCPWCHKTRMFLEEHDIPFKDIYVDKNARAAQEMIQKSGQQAVPVIDINGEIIVGFDEARLRKALKYATP